MTRPLLVLSALVLVLGAWNALLGARAARARSAGSRVGALFTSEESESLRKQPGLRIELGGETHTFGRVQGQWRCLSLFQAPADGRAVQALLDGLVQAEGMVQTSEVDEAPAYGINAPETIKVSVQGPRALQEPGGDVRATIEIGKSQPGRDACFVRRKGTREIWAIAGDLRALLAPRAAPGLPPLLAPAVAPGAWLERGGGTSAIEVRRGATGFRLERRERALDAAAARPGDLPWTWVLDPGLAERELAPDVAAAYVAFLEELPYAGVLDPATRDDLGLGVATVTLRTRAGPELVLSFGQSDAAGRVALWVEALEALYRVEASDFALAVPEAAVLGAAESSSEPWSAALRGRER